VRNLYDSKENVVELYEAMVWILGLVLFIGLLLVLYYSTSYEQLTEEHNAPYKLEPAEQLAVSDKPKKRGRPVGSKGGYTKRSAYWTDTRKRAAAKKARQAKIKAARAKARAAVGR
jgi:hypothetical protein